MHRMHVATLFGWFVGIVLWGFGNPAAAEQLRMAPRTAILTDRAPLFAVQPKASTEHRQTASLFAGQSSGSLLAPYPARPQRGVRVAAFTSTSAAIGPIARIRHLIASAEAGKHGYDAVQHAAKRRPSKAPTDMTIQEIYNWIAQTPGQQHAIGRYQFIPVTLKRLVKKRGINRSARFSPDVQDQLADELLKEAGLGQIMRGDMPRRTFMHNLAKIWAGLPTSSGHSYYKGVAGNRATMSWAHFDAEMRRIFPG
ncbi:hypothetical protein [Pelagimonas varians]|uniref:Muramidase (Phage lambda lysozyme) n=1 Tax=Pelagimonas varians TaxID=696760 RepID=A0A238KRF8_9RHOB|nr:hypothetical protein [Pelagimonas varians]PYG28607.1 hypothetical protein C8N36_111107 [Pelagimonas varians]SMX45385.1 hypothetical protein PEV8663_03028 [Pelagimonas varians]